MRIKLKELKLLGKFNGVNFQATYEFEFDAEENINTISVIMNMTEKLHLAGIEPPVNHQPKKERSNPTAATGQHPLDRVPALDDWGESKLCPNDKSPLFIIRGVSKKTDRPWAKEICEKCEYGEFLNNKRMKELQ